MHPIQSCIVGEDVEGRPRRRRADTVERLLDAALETFAEIGFAAASVEDICRRGGFTRGAFYSSFRTKDELFAALYARETSRDLERVERQLAGIEQEADPVGTAIERCLSTLRTDRTWVLVHAEYALHAARHPEAAALLHRHATALHERLTAIIDDAGARLGLRLAVPSGQLARIALALHDGFALQQTAVQQVSVPEPAGTERPKTHPIHPAANDLERTALLLLLRAVITD